MTVRQVLADEHVLELSGAGYEPVGQVHGGRPCRAAFVRTC